MMQESIWVQGKRDCFQLSQLFPYDGKSTLYLRLQDNKISGYAKIGSLKKLYKQDSFGMIKEFQTVTLLDFFILPDNDLLDESKGAKEFLE